MLSNSSKGTLVDKVHTKSVATEHDTELWLRLIRDQRCSSLVKWRLYRDLASPELVLNELRSRFGGRGKVSRYSVRDDLAWLQQSNHHFLPVDSAAFPNSLRKLDDAPLGLFAIGDLGHLDEPAIAMVGSRRPTPVGQRWAQQISNELAELGIVVVSGMALGIDAISHRGALQAKGGSLAVLGSGLDCVYPAANRRLFDDLCETGLVVSEYPLGQQPTRYTFPHRNRIVSGLSLGVILVEAAAKSGTLITAQHALNQGREVMVVPGSALSKQYSGSHKLIQEGAHLVSALDDIVFILRTPLGSCFKPSAARSNGNESGKASNLQSPILQFIGSESTSLDCIIRASKLTASEVASELLELELMGLVASTVDGGYINLS